MTMSTVDPVMHRRHDLFNLFCLPVILYYLSCFLIDFYRGNHADFLFVFSVGEVYFLVDTLWLIIWPHSVASPKLIIGHHFLSALGWYLPILVPDLAPWVSACLLVEVNTFFLIAKRYFHDVNYMRVLLKICFHITWVTLRVIMYPAIVYFYSYKVIAHCQSQGTYVNVQSLGFVLVSCLTILNMKWSYDLYFGKATPKAKHGL
mmetsp:Transcript_24451/g.35946  ORF Transcript_24451/g.35946 Transcript_24451/m.35946 type:complete len:204 (+) Transcript_24451:79-690(+)